MSGSMTSRITASQPSAPGRARTASRPAAAVWRASTVKPASVQPASVKASTVKAASNGDVPADDNNQCTDETCNAGVPAHEAMAVSGHQTRSMFDRYSLTLKAQTRAALERVTSYTVEHAAAPVVVPLEGARRSQRAANTDTPREEEAKIRRGKAAKGTES